MASNPTIIGIYDEETGRGEFFTLTTKDNKVRWAHTVCSDDDGNTKCNCSVAKFRAHEKSEELCPHQEIVKNPTVDTPSGSIDWTRSYGEESSKVGYPLLMPIIYNTGDGWKVVPTSARYMNAAELAHQVREGNDHGMKQHAENGLINSQLILDQLRMSDKRNCELDNQDILALVEEDEKMYGPVIASMIEDDFDTSLTDGDFLHDKKTKSKAKTTGSKPWNLTRPDPAQFFVEQDVWEQGLRALVKGKNICLTGPSGCGKTEVLHLMSSALGLDLESINMGATSEPRDTFIGTVEYDPKQGTHLCRSRFARFLEQKKGVLLLDEITRGSRDANNILLPLLDRQAYIALDEEAGGAKIERGEDIAFAATANVGMEYTGTEALDIALKQRFHCTIDLYFPPVEAEIRVLQGRTGVEYDNAKTLCEAAAMQRDMKQSGEFIEEISTRMLLEAAEMLVDGFSMIDSVKFSILNIFSKDGEESSERAKVLQMFQKHDPSFK